MPTKFYHGEINVAEIADVLVARFNRSNLEARKSVSRDRAVVQIGSNEYSRSGGDTALGVTLIQNEEGVSVTVGKQAWLGIAASLGITVISAISNPLNILGRLDDLAQDFENMGLDEEVWTVIDEVASAMGASQELSDKLRNLMCEYCGVANNIGEPDCVACGAPLGNVQPIACPFCGHIMSKDLRVCPNCGKKL